MAKKISHAQGKIPLEKCCVHFNEMTAKTSTKSGTCLKIGKNALFFRVFNFVFSQSNSHGLFYFFYFGMSYIFSLLLLQVVPLYYCWVLLLLSRLCALLALLTCSKNYYFIFIFTTHLLRGFWLLFFFLIRIIIKKTNEKFLRLIVSFFHVNHQVDLDEIVLLFF